MSGEVLGHDEFETAVAASPTDPDHLVAAWIEWDGATRMTLVNYGRSLDGGATWQSARADFGGTWPVDVHSADPTVAVDSHGTSFLELLAFSRDPGSTFPCCVYVARSTDGGATFRDPVLVPGGDKPWVGVDPATDDIYVTSSFAEGPVQWAVGFSKSVDHGETFSARAIISRGASQGIGAIPVFGPDGEVYVIWADATASRKIFLDESLDRGETWLRPDRVVVPDVTRPHYGTRAIQPFTIPAAAVDRSTGPHRGRILVAWPDARYGDPDILLTHSDDAGSSWSDPVRVNDDSVGNGAEQFLPTVNVDSDGGVHVTFLDTRDDPANALYSQQLATSTDGGTTFGPNVEVSDGSHPHTNFFVGDYASAVVAGGKLHPVWPDARLGDQDIFTHAVDLADYDGDGILNDGDGNGQYADHRCTGGQASACDDNCPGVANPAQADADGDGVGDACDLCPAVADADQADQDRDHLGIACDPDDDGDGVLDEADNCPLAANADQADRNHDGTGDACDRARGQRK